MQSIRRTLFFFVIERCLPAFCMIQFSLRKGEVTKMTNSSLLFPPPYLSLIYTSIHEIVIMVKYNLE